MKFNVARMTSEDRIRLLGPEAKYGIQKGDASQTNAGTRLKTAFLAYSECHVQARLQPSRRDLTHLRIFWRISIAIGYSCSRDLESHRVEAPGVHSY